MPELAVVIILILLAILVFGFNKKRHVILRPDMIKPVDKPIKTRDAKTLYRKYMKSVKFFDDSQTLAESVSYLRDDIKETEEGLRDDREGYKCELASAKADLKEAKKRLPDCFEDERADFETELEDAETDVQWISEELETTVHDLAEFRKDKRLYLVDYINSEVQGTNYDSKLAFWRPNKPH